MQNAYINEDGWRIPISSWDEKGNFPFRFSINPKDKDKFIGHAYFNGSNPCSIFMHWNDLGIMHCMDPGTDGVIWGITLDPSVKQGTIKYHNSCEYNEVRYLTKIIQS